LTVTPTPGAGTVEAPRSNVCVAAVQGAVKALASAASAEVQAWVWRVDVSMSTLCKCGGRVQLSALPGGVLGTKKLDGLSPTMCALRQKSKECMRDSRGEGSITS